MISTGNNMMKWGILLSIIHMPVFGRFEILPAFVGYFLIMRGMYSICQDVKQEYMDVLKGESTRLFIYSVIYWVTAVVLGYFSLLNKLIMVLFYLFDVLFFGNFLSKLVKYFKEKMRTEEAEKLRGIRMSFAKAYMALIVFFMVTIVPTALMALGVGSETFWGTIGDILYYIFISLMVLLKLWLSIIVQKYSV